MDKAEKLSMGHIIQSFISNIKDFGFILCAKEFTKPWSKKMKNPTNWKGNENRNGQNSWRAIAIIQVFKRG